MALRSNISSVNASSALAVAAFDTADFVAAAAVVYFLCTISVQDMGDHGSTQTLVALAKFVFLLRMIIPRKVINSHNLVR